SCHHPSSALQNWLRTADVKKEPDASVRLSYFSYLQISVRVEVHTGPVSCQILVIGLTSDHSTIITAQRQRRQIQLQAIFPASALQIPPDPLVGRHTSGGYQSGPAAAAGSLHGPGHQFLADSRRH